MSLQSFKRCDRLPASRLLAFFFGMEDMALALNCEPDAPLAVSVFFDLALCTAGLGLNLLGYPSSIADFQDLDKFRHGVEVGVFNF